MVSLYMSRYDTLIENLVSQEVDINSTDEYLITIYIPFNFTNIEESKIKAKSALLEKLRNYKELSKQGRFHEALVDTVNYYMNQIPVESKGVAFFIRGKVSDVLGGKERNIPQSNITILPIYIEFESDVYIGKVFNLDQLVWSNRWDKSVLVVTLEVNNTLIYVYRNDRLKQVYKMVKSEWDFTKPKHFAKTNITGYFSAVYGSGKDKFERFDRQTVDLFVDNVLENIDEELRNGIDDVIIYYSNEFSPFVDDIEEYIWRRFNIKAKLIHKNLREKDIVVRDVLEVLKSERKSVKSSLLEKAKASSILYVEGWEDVTDMSREGRIGTLFVRHKLSQEGYVLNGLVYTGKVGDSERIDNIYPWLVRSIVSASGELVLFYEDDEENVEVSALLRY